MKIAPIIRKVDRQRNRIPFGIHQPANVDEEAKFKAMLNEIINASHGLPIIFPIHPRTVKITNQIYSMILHGGGTTTQNHTSALHLIEPLNYLGFNYLVENAKAEIPDSGGITEKKTP